MNSILIKISDSAICPKCRKIKLRAICPKCRKIKLRKDLKYVNYIFSPNCFAICSECRNRIQRNKIMRLLIKDCEF